MIYTVENPCFRGFIDRMRTGSYGENFVRNYIICDGCGIRIRRGDDYYKVKGSCFCLASSDTADGVILSQTRSEYLYEL